MLFYHRGLQCLVAMELKIGKFKPEYISKMDFYLEALDRQKKKEYENPEGLAPEFTIKGSQFKKPKFEFSGSCAGCGETPYAKLLTQLFGDRVYWANATGCSQAWGSPMPGIPYTTNKRGFGPAWTNSLFENNAELALGMFLSVKQQRLAQKSLVEAYLEETGSETAKNWLDAFDDFDKSREATDALVAELEDIDAAAKNTLAEKILQRKDQLSKKCFWMFGGDGWAYDIGFGGLDHVMSQGEPVKVFAFQNMGMTEYWGDNQESYGPVTTDRIQTVFVSDTQTITLKHEAHNRSLFAEGAIAAAEYLVKCPAGLYDMNRMITGE